MIDHWLTLAPAGRGLIALWLAVLAALAALGVHRFSLAFTASRAPATPPLPPPRSPSELPIVTVQLPIFNERYVVERLIAAVGALDWPRERLEVQVLDDSTDDTTARAAAAIARLRTRGIDAVLLHRSDRTGYKAGALRAGLAAARGSLLAIFDADFVPASGFLRDTVPHFADPAVGLVQVRWGHLNRGDSWLTRVQAVLLDGHFLVEHRARAARGRFFNFNGTAGVWRRTAIATSGGWQSDTLTEDLDLSYRAQLRGWRFVFLGDVVAPAELPRGFNAYKGQQHRWAKGSAQAARKLLPSVLRAPLPWRVKLEAVLHLTANFAYPLLLALALLAGPAIELRQRDGWNQALAIDLPFFLFATLSVAAFYARPLREDSGSARRWLLLPGLMALGIGMSLHNTRAVLAGLVERRGEFRRTPKHGDGGLGSNGYRTGFDGGVVIETLLAALFVLLLVRAASEGLLVSLPFLALFAAGFGAVAVGSILDAIPERQREVPQREMLEPGAAPKGTPVGA